MSNDKISEILIVVLGVMLFVLLALVVIFLVLKAKEKRSNKKIRNEVISDKNKKGKSKSTVDNSYSKQSIMDFMEFEKIEDSMIIQKKGKRFLMIVECQGVNYDLMSTMEKNGVEEGFQQFLNTLRHPIQIYIQTRTINLEGSINTYKDKVKAIEDSYNRMNFNYKQMVESEEYTREQLQKAFFELTKQKNLLEYGKDIVANTEKMSLNKNVLNKKYYIVIPYYLEESTDEKYDNEEIKNRAFSELYTNAQSIIRTLSSCSVNGKILNSKELVELLYIAYNRDESETFDINKIVRTGYDELYSTAPDVYEKKVKALDAIIEERAIELANENIEKVVTRKQREAEEKEGNLEELVKKMAQIVLEENKRYVGEEVAEEAIEEIRNTEEGGSGNEKIKEKRTRRTTAK